MQDGVGAARERLLQTVRSGDWERVPNEADAYGAAVRADERRRVLDDVAEAITRLFEPDAESGSRQQWRDRCLAAVERLR